MKPLKTEEIRKSALESVDGAERRFKQFVILAAMCEAVLLTAFMLVMDRDVTLHWLILISSLLVYVTLSIGLVALGGYVRMNTLRVLTALDLGREPGD